MTKTDIGLIGAGRLVLVMSLLVLSCERPEAVSRKDPAPRDSSSLDVATPQRAVKDEFEWVSKPTLDVPPSGELAALFRLGSDHTDIQRRRKLDSLKGAHVRWALPIYEIRLESEGNYRVQTTGDETVGTIISLRTRNAQEKRLVESLKTGEVIAFDGVITGETTLRHLEIKPAILQGGEFQSLQIQAHANDHRAQAMLGVAYVTGSGIPQNQKIGWGWIARAIAAGNPEGCDVMNMAFVKDIFPERDRMFAAIKEGAQGGHPTCQLSLAHAYRLTRDPEEGAGWAEKAAYQGNSDAQLLLGSMYATGEGLKRDPIEAFKWVALSGKKDGLTDEGHQEALKRIAEWKAKRAGK